MKNTIRRIVASTLSAALILTSSIAGAILPAQAASAPGNTELSRRAAAEGMVLLENPIVEQTGKKSLPIAKGETVAMFGRAMIDYVRGGGGSGATNVQYTRNILQGMQVWEADGQIKLVPELTDFYTQQVTTNGIKDDANINITDEVWNAAKNATETAVVTIGRTSSEGSDRNAAKGDYYLSDAEVALITKVAAEFDNTIVVLNIGAVMDTSWIKGVNAIPGVDAVLNAWQAGMEGGLATADILVGHVNPSGKLVDTWAKDYSDYPSSETFKESNSYVNYTEDIFVGYRYFETIPGAAEKVNYPFGYGLSYTDFATAIDSVKVEGEEIVVTATVTNTGDVAGKQVVQVYFTAPRGKLTKPAKELAAFGKTGLLNPGASETLVMRFAISDMSSYDDTGVIQKSAYVMEKGDYTFFVGNSIRDGKYVDFAYTVNEDTVVEQLTEKLAPNQLPKRMLEDGSYVDVQRAETFDPNYVLHEGVNRVEMENFIHSSGDITIESYYDENLDRQYCMAYMQTAGRFAEYSITVPAGMAGRYSVLMCFANGNGPTEDCFKVSVNGEPQPGVVFNAHQTGNLNGATGEWYNFAMAQEAFYINLEEGENRVRFTANKNNPNYEYMLLERVGDINTDYPTRISGTGVNVIQAEKFDDSGRKADSTSNMPAVESFGNNQGCLAMMNYHGNYVKYLIHVEEAGTYELKLVAANGRAGFDFQPGVQVDNEAYPCFLNCPQTGDGSGKSEWYNFVELDPITVQLPKGNCVLSLTDLTTSYPNIDYMTLEKVGEAQTRAIDVTEDNVTFQAESIHQFVKGTNLTPYRLENFTVAGNAGTCLAYMNYAGNQVGYRLNVAEAGEYDVYLCAANGRADFTFNPHLVVNGVEYSSTMTCVQTGDGDGKSEWFNFVNLEPITVHLDQGMNLLTVTCEALDKFPNLDTITIKKHTVAAAPSTNTPVRTMAVAEDEKIMLLDVYNDRSLMPAFLDQLTIEELAQLLSAQGNRDGGNTQGWGNNMTYGIPLVMTADGPQGIRIGTTCTAWPISTCLAASWDVNLIAEVGRGAAIEAHQNNMDIWLAPGMNIHRDPLCGRNFEYYSEDPLVTGKMAASITKAVQSEGVAISLKHFAANNKETNRSSSDSRATERALREIYLRGFEIAVKEADPWTIMSSYNYINGTETAENHDLLNGILRGEWGFDGVVETDWGNNTNHVYEVLAGNDVKMTNSQPELLVAAVANGKLSREMLEVGAQRVLELIMKVNYFHDRIVNVPVTEITADTRFKAAEGIEWSKTVQGEACSDVDGGKNLGYCDAGAWAQYNIDVEKTGYYDLSARTASSSAGGAFNVLVDGEVIATFNPTVTGGWQSWTTLPAQQIYLDAGRHVMRIEFTKSGSNLNWLQFTLTEEVLPDVPLAVVNQPATFKGAIGGTATFHVDVTRKDVTYQWMYSNNGGKSFVKSSMTGADTDTLAVEMKAFRVGQMYKCVITDSKGNVVETDAVAMTTATTLAIVTGPVDYTGAVGDTAVFTVEAQGEGLSYQWMYSNNQGRSWSKSTLPGYNTAEVSVELKAFRAGQLYKCVVTDASGNVVESNSASIAIG